MHRHRAPLNQNPLQGAGHPKVLRVIWAVFALFIVYGTLIPFNVDCSPNTIIANISDIVWTPFIDSDGTRASIPDVVQNILLFIPFGFLGFLALTSNRNIRIFIVVFSGFFLSLSVETLQLLTIDRSTSVTDLATNGSGAFIGTVLAMLCVRLCSVAANWPFVQECYRDKYFPLVLMSTIVVMLSTLQPFDFTLDAGIVWSSMKSLIRNPFCFDPVLKDEGVAFIKFFLFGCAWTLWLKERKIRWAFILGFFITALISIFFEGTQIIVRSRMPSLQDIAVIIPGCCLGAIMPYAAPVRVPRSVWAVLAVFATALSAGMHTLSPFKPGAAAQVFNWIPFLSYYERTTFVALANFIESMLSYFPMGFILQYLYHDRKLNFTIILLCLMIAFPLEFFQGCIQGRYPDITDVIGALTGGAFGVWASTVAKKDFTSHTAAC